METLDGYQMVYQENVPEGADAERVMTQMALSGADLIFTTSYGFMDPTINVAKKKKAAVKLLLNGGGGEI